MASLNHVGRFLSNYDDGMRIYNILSVIDPSPIVRAQIFQRPKYKETGHVISSSDILVKKTCATQREGLARRAAAFPSDTDL